MYLYICVTENVSFFYKPAYNGSEARMWWLYWFTKLKKVLLTYCVATNAAASTGCYRGYSHFTNLHRCSFWKQLFWVNLILKQLRFWNPLFKQLILLSVVMLDPLRAEVKSKSFQIYSLRWTPSSPDGWCWITVQDSDVISASTPTNLGIVGNFTVALNKLMQSRMIGVSEYSWELRLDFPLLTFFFRFHFLLFCSQHICFLSTDCSSFLKQHSTNTEQDVFQSVTRPVSRTYHHISSLCRCQGYSARRLFIFHLFSRVEARSCSLYHGCEHKLKHQRWRTQRSNWCDPTLWPRLTAAVLF